MSIRILARTAVVAGIAMASATAASADVFMKVDGLPGDARQSGFEGQITLTGASMNISSYAMPDPDGLVESLRTTSVGPIFINKMPDRSSPRLMMSAVEGAPLGTVEISFTSSTRAGQPQTVEGKWILEGAEVRSINVFPDTSNGNATTETVEISYASMRYQYFGKDAKGQRTGSMEEVKWSVPESQLFPFDEGCR
ncbi:MAG TPA: type VI secretion system tube protein Hcp [Hyphomonadaceae bacterium]|nr:type VI secretion system tube protein Hcp [Hyphomonadaceae bacterium]